MGVNPSRRDDFAEIDPEPGLGNEVEGGGICGKDPKESASSSSSSPSSWSSDGGIEGSFDIRAWIAER